MSQMEYRISAFGDEIDDDLAVQVRELRNLGIAHLELRGAWGTNVLHMDDEMVERVEELCHEGGVGISCIGSPIGKSPLKEPVDQELDNLRRIIEIGEALDVRMIRMFSFYPPDTSSNVGYDQHVPEAAERLRALAELAESAGFTLVMENEKEIVGDTPERCCKLLEMVDSPALQFAWDPANFVQVGVSQPMGEGWQALAPYVAHVHIKDAVVEDGSVRPAGEGDGQVPALLKALEDMGYEGFLALEPHLVVAGHSSGFSGVQGMARAVGALRKLMDEAGLSEAKGVGG